MHPSIHSEFIDIQETIYVLNQGEGLCLENKGYNSQLGDEVFLVRIKDVELEIPSSQCLKIGADFYKRSWYLDSFQIDLIFDKTLKYIYQGDMVAVQKEADNWLSTQRFFDGNELPQDWLPDQLNDSQKVEWWLTRLANIELPPIKSDEDFGESDESIEIDEMAPQQVEKEILFQSESNYFQSLPDKNHNPQVEAPIQEVVSKSETIPEIIPESTLAESSATLSPDSAKEELIQQELIPILKHMSSDPENRTRSHSEDTKYIKVPKLGLKANSGVIREVYVTVGEKVRQEQRLFKVRNEEISKEIVAPFSAEILEINFKNGERVRVDQEVILLSPADVPSPDNSQKNASFNIKDNEGSEKTYHQPNEILKLMLIINVIVLFKFNFEYLIAMAVFDYLYWSNCDKEYTYKMLTGMFDDLKSLF